MKSVTKILVWVLILTQSFNVCVYGFNDLDPESETTEYIEEFYERGLTNGYPDGSFRPSACISRSEFIALINRTFQFEASDTQLDYTDIKESDWFIEDLKIAVDKGYIKGYPDKTFRPYKNITRQEVAVVLNRILELEPTEYTDFNDEVPSWCRDAVMSMASHGIMFAEDGLFHADVDITREDSVVSLLTVLHQEEAAREETMTEEPETVATATTTSTKDPDNTGTDIGPNVGRDRPDLETVYALEVTVEGLEDVMKQETLYAKKLEGVHLELIDEIQANMESYLEDYTYDYESNAKVVKAEIDKLPQEEQDYMEYAIRECVPYKYLNRLDEYFNK